MEPNGLPGGMFPNMSSGMLGLEMSLQHHLPPQNPKNPHFLQQHPHHSMVSYAHPEAGRHLQAQQQSVKQGYQCAKNPSLTLSDEDEPGLTAEDNTVDEKKKNISPWHRMKWTDGMVRLLIMVVFYIGDEAGSDGNDPTGKKKNGGVLQKKGKWKSVSRAMMERGFYVSPQQCEDKFNDLNKRYKRVNDILGKGTACRVVENQSLLDTMDHLSPKMREEVKKLLNSKHLFFREMCAYHNSCGGGGSSSGGAHHSPEAAAEPSQTQQQSQQQRCLHSLDNSPIGPNSGRAVIEGSKLAKGGSGEDEEEDDEEEDEDEDEEDDDEDDEAVEGGRKGHEEEDDTDERSSRKKQRKGMTSTLIQQLGTEMMTVVQDGTKSSSDKRQWLKTRLMQLEEQRMSYQLQAFELEKQRFKWFMYCRKKEREMEREKLGNERMRLENERMVLLLRQKELDLQQQQQLQSSN